MYNQRKNIDSRPRTSRFAFYRNYQGYGFPPRLSSSQVSLPMVPVSYSTQERNSDTHNAYSNGSLNSQVDAIPECTIEYLSELNTEKKQLDRFPKPIETIERLLHEEVNRVHTALFRTDFLKNEGKPMPKSKIVTLKEKVYVPVNDYPEYNFVGRILGPRGMTAKQLISETGCNIMIRGRGSCRDNKKEEEHKGEPFWEHLNDELHVLLQCEDTEERARVKLAVAKRHVMRMLVPAPQGKDGLKRKQLMELAIINGNYRPYHNEVSLNFGNTVGGSGNLATLAMIAPPAKFASPAESFPPAKYALPALVAPPAKFASTTEVVPPAKIAPPAKFASTSNIAPPAKFASTSKIASPVKIDQPAPESPKSPSLSSSSKCHISSGKGTSGAKASSRKYPNTCVKPAPRKDRATDGLSHFRTAAIVRLEYRGTNRKNAAANPKN